MQAGGGGGNRTLCRPFRKTAASRDFRGHAKHGRRDDWYLLPCPIPLESPGVLLSLGEIVESGGKGFPAPDR